MSQRRADAPAGLDSITELLDAVAAVAASGQLPGPQLLERLVAARPTLSALAAAPPCDQPYSRTLVRADHRVEMMLARWRPGHGCAPHDHGGSGGFVVVVDGAFTERRFAWSDADLVATGPVPRHPDAPIPIAPEVIHDMTAHHAGLTLHVYHPPPTRMRVFDLDRGEALDLVGDYGAWIPTGDHRRLPFADIAPTPVIWIGYTTEYRGGSAEFATAAATMADELAAAHPDAQVIVAALRGKADFAAALTGLADAGRVIDQLHLIGHAGMYGPMFGSTRWPEQFSPHEWRTLPIPFSPAGSASFHACRTARWFAPFFAEVFGVPSFGNRDYTTVSAAKDHFAWAGRRPATRPKLYLIATPGRKSHGWAGSVRKYLGSPADALVESRPTRHDRSYDAVAALYDRAYADIRVRAREWRWVAQRAAQARAELGRPLRMLDIGCGNGALLRALDEEGELEVGVGVDRSAQMVTRARIRQKDRHRLRFSQVDDPRLPLPDDHIDVVVSFLSFRYLDWDPIMAEIRRVLVPGGRLWVVDMVEQPVRCRELGVLARSAVDHWRAPRRYAAFAADLATLTNHPQWREMLRHNPIRAEHEYCWYFSSRFPGRRLEVLTATPTQRVVAFDSGGLAKGRTEPLTFP